MSAPLESLDGGPYGTLQRGAQGSAGLGIREGRTWVFPKCFRGGSGSDFESMFSETINDVMPERLLETKALYKIHETLETKGGPPDNVLQGGLGAQASVGRVSAGPYRGVPKRFPKGRSDHPQDRIDDYLKFLTCQNCCGN